MFSRLFGCYNAKSVSNAKTNAKTNTKTNAKDKPETNAPNKIEWSNTLQFVPPINTGIVIRVYDGDTFTIAVNLPYDGSPLYRFSVILNGIDRIEEKDCAIRARKELGDLILNKTITLKNIKNEKYGRILADVYVDNIHVNQHMIDKGFAIPYASEAKITKSWFEIYKNNKTNEDPRDEAFYRS